MLNCGTQMKDEEDGGAIFLHEQLTSGTKPSFHLWNRYGTVCKLFYTRLLSTENGQLSGESVPVSTIHINADLNQRNIPPGGFRTARRANTLATPTIPASLCLTPDKSIILALSLRLRIHMFLGLLDPDPLLRDMDPHPSIIKQLK